MVARRQRLIRFQIGIAPQGATEAGQFQKPAQHAQLAGGLKTQPLESQHAGLAQIQAPALRQERAAAAIFHLAAKGTSQIRISQHDGIVSRIFRGDGKIHCHARFVLR